MGKDKSWFRRHWFLTTVGGILLFLTIVAVIAPNEGTSPRNTQSAPAETAIRITARNLFIEYGRNEIKADSQYEGKLLKINGTIKGIF